MIDLGAGLMINADLFYRRPVSFRVTKIHKDELTGDNGDSAFSSVFSVCSCSILSSFIRVRSVALSASDEPQRTPSDAEKARVSAFLGELGG
jgi:hypothetical protein